MDESKNGKAGLTRRDFMKAASVTAASLAVGTVAKSPVYAIAPGRVIGANDRLNLGIVGVGGQGGNHLNIVRAQPPDTNLKLVAVCDLWDKRRLGAAKAAELPESKAYKDYRNFIEDKDLDAIIIATVEHWHARIATAAMENGLHCYIEKPLCRKLEEIQPLVETAQRTKRVVQVGTQGSSDTKWHTAAAQIKQGKIGKLVWSQGSYCRNSKEGEWEYFIDPDADPTKNLDWKMWLGYTPKIPWSPERYFRWRKFKDYSGGILSDLFPHRISPLMVAVGAQYPVEVGCVGAIICQPDRDVADTTQVIAKYADGTQMIIAGSTCNEQGLQDVIRGHEATIYFGGDKVEIRPERPFSDQIDQEDVPVIGPGEDIGVHQRDWYNCIRNGGTPNANIEVSAMMQTVVCLADLSWRENKMMRFDPVKRRLI